MQPPEGKELFQPCCEDGVSCEALLKKLSLEFSVLYNYRSFSNILKVFEMQSPHLSSMETNVCVWLNSVAICTRQSCLEQITVRNKN